MSNQLETSQFCTLAISRGTKTLGLLLLWLQKWHTLKRFEQLLKTLNQSELEMSSYDLADLCWLLLHSSQITEPTESKKEVENISAKSNSSSSDSQFKQQQQDQKKEKEKNKEFAGQLFPRQRSKDSFVGGGSPLTFAVDNPSDLGSSLSLARALKPLLRRIPTQDRPSILDEEGTVENFAATDKKILAPVFKPTLEPWLELALIVERSSSMDIWHQTLVDLNTVLQHYGIFGNVQVWQLAPRENNLVVYKGLNKINSRVSHPKELLNPNGRRIILVVSDCVPSYWQDGRIFPLLELWSKSSPLAILQMLPEWLWLKTGLGLGAKVTFASDEPGVINNRLKIRDVLLWENVFHDKNHLQIPVFTLEAFSIERWSGVVVGRSDAKVAGFLLTSDSFEELDTAADINLTPEEIVRRFRNNASPLAQELAELLAAAPTIFLPVVRLIRKEMLPQAGQVQIAEVFLGGILRVRFPHIKETDPDLVLYDFIHPQVRNILQRSSTRSTTVDVFDRVSKYIAKQLNLSLRDFLAELKKPLTEVNKERQGIIRPFAEVAATILRNLGGNYLAIAQQLEKVNYSTSEITQIMGISLQPFDFNYKEIEITLDEEKTQELQSFEFETVTVNARGEEINREQKQAYYFVESLGEELEIEMVSIPGGIFEMGSPEDEPKRRKSESPQHTVTVQPFFMGKYPVTQAQWRFVAQLPQIERELKTDSSNLEGDNLPVKRVSWYDAMEFCSRLSKYTGREYLLPSEAEWEYACRAETTTAFHFGETITGELANYDARETYANEPKMKYRGEITPVGQFSANPFGLHDMHGNVWEWCLDDWHDNYEKAPANGIAWIDNENDNRSQSKVLRGGSWDYDPEGCRSACRDVDDPGFRLNLNGFRVVCAVAQRILQ